MTLAGFLLAWFMGTFATLATLAYNGIDRTTTYGKLLVSAVCYVSIAALVAGTAILCPGFFDPDNWK